MMSVDNHASGSQTSDAGQAMPAIEGLVEAINTPLERNDLGRLAQMHGRCEELVAIGDGGDVGSVSTIREIAGPLMTMLEAIILDEATDADAGMVLIPRVVESLHTVATGGSIDTNQLLNEIRYVTTGEGTPVTVSPAPQTTPSASNDTPSTPSVPESISGPVGRLVEAISSRLSPNDLGRLAQMHSRCEDILAATEHKEAQISPAFAAIAPACAGVLGGIILDEVTDVDAAIDLVQKSVNALSQIVSGETVDYEPLVTELKSVLADDTTPTNNDSKPASEPTPVVADVAPTPEPQPTETLQPVEEVKPEPAPAPVQQPVSASAESTSSVTVEPFVSQPLVPDMDDTESLQGFIDESREHLDTIEVALLDVEQNPSDADKINELFRPFHTIKGIAGFLNLRDINCLTHEAETILDMGRKGTLTITPPIIDLIFASIDVLKAQIDELAKYMTSPSGDHCPQPPCSEMIERLRRVAAGEMPTESAAATPTPQTPQQAEASTVPTTESQAKTSNTGSAAADRSIRVDTTKLDALVDTVGELVIAQTMVNLHDGVDQDENLRRAVSQVTKIVRDVQEASMAMRMIPVGGTFQKMKRLVRDVARKAGKTVELVVSGEDTELDKNVIQKIADPLVHMVRNSVDHGIESTADRVAAGKNTTGLVYLDAYHEGDNVVIEIRDDGKGLDPKQLIAKGIERGVISPEDQLTDQQAFNLIMAAGFSTAEQITDISGRGVGMDVVKRNIEELRGKLEIDSELGKGSVFRIRLPLTLAIIDGMIIKIGEERVVIPTILIEQSLRPDPKQITTVQRKGEMLQVRGELCPIVQIGQIFDYCGRIDPCESLVVICNSGETKIGVVVSELIGQQQVVIKSLGDRFKCVDGVSGAAILGDGRVGLILEPTGILKRHNSIDTGQLPSPDSVANEIVTEQVENTSTYPTEEYTADEEAVVSE